MRVLRLFALWPILLTACPDAPAEAALEPLCVPGAVVACACEGGGIGTQTCDADGAALSACACAPCTPLTCADADRACGLLDDGCGAVVVCGTCGDDERCDDGTCVCGEGLVRDAAAACVAPAVDVCGLGLDDCAVDARCDNDADAGFTCRCLPGFVGDGRTCLADLCGQGQHDCGDNSTCTSTDAGAVCACRAGYVGDGRRCVPGPDAIADLTASPPVLVLQTDSNVQSSVLVEGLSRIGWDIPVGTIEVPRGNGTTFNRKFPSGPAVFPVVKLRGLRGRAADVNAIVSTVLARASDANTLSGTLSLPQPGGGVLSVNVVGRVRAADPTIVDDGDTSVLGGFDLEPTTIALEPFSTVQPTLPAVRPGHVLEFEGIGIWSFGFTDTDGLPADGPFVTRKIQPITAVMNRAIAVRNAAAAAQDLRTLGVLFAFSLITVQHTGLEVGRRNGFETWASNVSVFTPDVDVDRTGLQIVWQIDLGEDA